MSVRILQPPYAPLSLITLVAFLLCNFSLADEAIVSLANSKSEDSLVTPAMRREAEKPTWVGDTDKLPAFPKPHPEKAFADLNVKILQPDGSILRTPREDWEAARKLVATDPVWRDWIEKKRAVIDSWMLRHHDRTEWRAGWWHDFVSPKDGSFLIWTEDIPGEQTQSFRSKSGHNVPLTPKLVAAWIGTFRKKHTATMADAARMYRITGDICYGEWAASQLDFYAGNYEKWPLSWDRKHPARLGIHCLDDATLLTNLTETARILFDTPSAPATRRESWRRQLFIPHAQMLGQSYHVIHNIATWMRAAQTQVALLYQDEELWQQAVEAPYGLRNQLRRGVTTDYFWYEQSMGYNDYVVTAVLPTLIFAGLTGQGERLREEAAIVQNLMISPLTIRFPDENRLPCPADATGTPRVPLKTLAAAAQILPTTIGINHAHSNLDWPRLLDPLTDLQTSISSSQGKAPVTLPPVTSRSMESSRFALLRQGSWQVFFHYGQIFQSHSQAEALNWSATFNGVDITHDPGTSGYGSKLNQGYFKRGLNHNVPLFGGEGQAGWAPGRLLGFQPGTLALPALVTAIQDTYRPGLSARRSLRIEGDALVDHITLTRTAASKKSATLSLPGLTLHFQGTPRLTPNFQPDGTLAKGRPAAFRYWENISSARFTDHAQWMVEFPEGITLSVTLDCPGFFVIYQGSAPDSPPNRRAGFYVEMEQPLINANDSVSITTRLAPLVQKTPPVLEPPQ